MHQLLFHIHGEDVRVEAIASAPLQDACVVALKMARAEAMPLDDWEVRGEQGQLLDPHRRVDALALSPRALLFLTRRVGCGG